MAGVAYQPFSNARLCPGSGHFIDWRGNLIIKVFLCSSEVMLELCF